MSGFGLKALKKKQTDENEIVKKEFFPTIVVGDNLAAFLLYHMGQGGLCTPDHAKEIDIEHPL